MSSFWRNPQNITALGVTLISVCALVVSIAQTRVMTQQSELMDVQARASVRPILMLGSDRSFDADTKLLTGYRLNVTNSGVGPATIDDVRIAFGGKAVRSWGQLFELFRLPDSIPTYANYSRLNNTILQAGENVTAIDLSENLFLARATYRDLGKLEIRILYSSIYGDQFEVRTTEDGWENIEREHRIASFGEESFGR